MLDVQSNNNAFHNNYQPVRHLSHGIEYLCKDMHSITNMPHLKNEKLSSNKQTFFQGFKERGIEKAPLEYTNQKYKALSTSSVNGLRGHFRDIKGMQDSL